MNILKNHNIDPYEFLGVHKDSDKETIKRAYKKKCKILHPDKTGGTTEVEFKLLYISYKYATDKCVNTSISTHQDLKEINRDTEIAYARNFYATNFEDQEVRNDLFAEDDMDFEFFKKQAERISNMSTSYVAEDFYKKELVESMKKNGKFDKDKFNALFLKLKKENKIIPGNNEIIKIDQVKPANDSDNYMRVNIHENNMITRDSNRSKGNYKTFMRQSRLSQADMETVLETDLTDINKLIKENKRNTGKMTKKKVKELAEKKFKTIEINTELSFSQMEKKIMEEQKNNVEKEQKRQEEYVKKHRRIFDNSICFN